MTDSEYRQDDRTEGYCPHCGYAVGPTRTTDGRGYCAEHGWVWCDWTQPLTFIETGYPWRTAGSTEADTTENQEDAYTNAPREPKCRTCGGSGQRATARTTNGRELARHERSGTPCDECGGTGIRTASDTDNHTTENQEDAA